ncbi:MAG: GGDEF domain-containing protein [Gammaproteobacteria bacterium]|nr:GGDEF domain-containing protein [Gammaproteobacteria bacterium]
MDKKTFWDLCPYLKEGKGADIIINFYSGWNMLISGDLSSLRNHSRDFCGTRAEYIQNRITVLALMLAIIIPLWIPVDLWLMPANAGMTVALLRLFVGGLFLGLWFWRGQAHRLGTARWRLGLLLLIPLLFYMSVVLLFSGKISRGALMGYTFFPFLLAALPAIFPLTLQEGLMSSFFVLFTFAGVEAFLGALFTPPVLGDLWLLALLAAIALAAEVAQLHMLLRLYRQASRDPLTGLVNRRTLFRSMEGEIDRCRRYDRPLSILFFDLDKFKRVNDTYGHLTGDAVLQAFARLINEKLRKTDLAGRYGGEEFVVMLPETDLAGAYEIAESIRLACHGAEIHGPDCVVNGFATSASVAELRNKEPIDVIFRRIDEALYAAKEAGRDCTVLAQ